MDDGHTILWKFARYAAWQDSHALDAAVMRHAKRAVLDWLSALYPGTRLAPGTCLVEACRDELGVGASRLPGLGLTAFPATAAWINGATSHTVELDDIFKDGIYHPGCPVIAAALALGDDQACSGQRFLTALVIGYEISTRIAAAVQPAHYRYFHTTGTIGCLGAAAAAAAILAPGDATVSLHAMASAASFASGLQQAFRAESMTKPLHAGHAAAVGVRAAQAARCGVTGAADILEGPVGLGAALAGTPDWTHADQGLGSDYNITHMTQKRHACCGHTFAAIDAALQLRAQHVFAADDIRRIDIHTYNTALEVTGDPAPETPFEGRFSLSYVVAHALVHGAVPPQAFTPERLHSPAIRGLMARVHLHADPALSAAFPGQRAARLRIALRDGTTLEAFRPHRQGDPEAPFSDAELNQKFTELVEPVLGAGLAGQLRTQVWALDTLALRALALSAPSPATQADPARAGAHPTR